MSQAFPSGTNTYVPTFDATGELIVSYSRNVKDFKLNEYVTITPVDKNLGLYLRLNPYTQTNVQNGGTPWADGNDAPTGPSANPLFEFVNYQTKRFTDTALLGYLAVQQAQWPIKDFTVAQLGPRLMTRRVKNVCDTITNPANHLASHVSTATSLGGGFFSAGTLTNAIIQKALAAAGRQIQLDTATRLKYSDLTLLIGPALADAMARSAEIREYIAQSPDALAQVVGNKKGQNALYGLPDNLYGMKLIIEDSTINTGNIIPATGNYGTTNFIWDSNTAVVLARPGDLVKNMGSSFSSVHLFMKEEMNVEQFDDVKNRRMEMRATDDYDVQVAAPPTAFLITNCLA